MRGSYYTKAFEDNSPIKKHSISKQLRLLHREIVSSQLFAVN